MKYKNMIDKKLSDHIKFKKHLDPTGELNISKNNHKISTQDSPDYLNLIFLRRIYDKF